MTLSELTDMFDPSVHERLVQLLEKQNVLGMAVYVCKMFDSSHFGSVQGLIFGEGCSIESEDALPPRIGDVPSRFHELEAVYCKPVTKG